MGALDDKLTSADLDNIVDEIDEDGSGTVDFDGEWEREGESEREREDKQKENSKTNNEIRLPRVVLNDKKNYEYVVQMKWFIKINEE